MLAHRFKLNKMFVCFVYFVSSHSLGISLVLRKLFFFNDASFSSWNILSASEKILFPLVVSYALVAPYSLSVFLYHSTPHSACFVNLC